jgi:leader peptidase (prepilin peptidase)/N-methyltransferase
VPSLTPLSVAFALVGLALGLVADRLATRWPEHDEPDESPPGRRPGWRTVVTGVVGAVAFGLLPIRFGGDLVVLGVFTAWVATLVVGLATDLDQRLLPNELTLPVIPAALLFDLSGRNPLVGDELALAIVAAIVIPAVLYLPSLPFGAGAFGIGDVKLLAGSGLMLGLMRSVAGVFVGLMVTGVVLVALLAARRIGRRSYIPFGPFLIIGALYGLLVR